MFYKFSFQHPRRGRRGKMIWNIYILMLGCRGLMVEIEEEGGGRKVLFVILVLFGYD